MHSLWCILSQRDRQVHCSHWTLGNLQNWKRPVFRQEACSALVAGLWEMLSCCKKKGVPFFRPDSTRLSFARIRCGMTLSCSTYFQCMLIHVVVALFQVFCDALFSHVLSGVGPRTAFLRSLRRHLRLYQSSNNPQALSLSPRWRNSFIWRHKAALPATLPSLRSNALSSVPASNPSYYAQKSTWLVGTRVKVRRITIGYVVSEPNP